MSSLKLSSLLRKTKQFDSRDAKKKEFWKISKQLKSYKRLLKKEGIEPTVSTDEQKKEKESELADRKESNKSFNNNRKSPHTKSDTAKATAAAPQPQPHQPPANPIRPRSGPSRITEFRRHAQKTSRGQPIMRGKIESLVDKIQRQNEKLKAIQIKKK